jgi:hypothetical protein
MNEERQPLLVELFMDGAKVTGYCHLVQERRRLVDVLNSVDETFEIESVCIALASGATREFPLLTVEKRAVRLAIPRETPAQARERAMLRTIVGRTETAAVNVTMLLPPFIVEGSAHIPRGVHALRRRLRADPDIFSRFFSITSAKLMMPDGSDQEAPVVLLNREMVGGVHLKQERRLDAVI